MVKSFKIVFIFFCLFLLAKIQLANDIDSTTMKLPPKRAFKVAPIVYFTPETRFGAGGMFFSVFKIDRLDSLTRKSNFQTYLSYTLNKQFSIENEWHIFFKNEKYISFGSLDYTRFPEYFYGIGNSTDANMRGLYSFDLISFQSSTMRKLAANLFAGIKYNFQYLFDIRKTYQSMMPFTKAPGADGYVASSVGGSVIYDSRKNILTPKNGYYLEAGFQAAHKVIGSEFCYNNFVLDVRKYFRFSKRFVWALHGYLNVNDGEVPFRVMPAIGGARYLRGYYRGRFRDNNLLVFQQELRVHLFWRLGMVLFGGMGQVSTAVNQINFSSFKYNYGTGVRINVNKKEDINLRFDIGFTKEGHGFYLVFAEAF